MDATTPLISVVTVVFNNVQSIRNTIESVINQTYRNVEYIVVDGGSTDGTPDIIKAYAGDISIIISEKDTGIYNAMNKGIGLASGYYINFMNSGDTFADSTTLEQVASLLATQKYDVVYGNVLVSKANNAVWLKSAPNKLKIMHHIPFCHQSTFVRNILMKEYAFDEKYKMSADFKFFKKCYLSNRSFFKIDIPICLFNSAGVSNYNRAAGLRENIAVVNELDKFFNRIIYNSRTYFVLCWMAIRKKNENQLCQ